MNETVLANFKKKLSIELETTTNDEATLISNIVDSASAGSLPAVSADDNGKVLTVSSGDWTAANIPSQLPTVTSVDEGKVLAVNNSGAWAAAQPSGGGAAYVTTMTITATENETVYSLTESYNDLKDVLDDGGIVFAVNNNDGDYSIYSLASLAKSGTEVSAYFIQGDGSLTLTASTLDGALSCTVGGK